MYDSLSLSSWGLTKATIGSNSCNGDMACFTCAANNIVPDNACNKGLTDDFTDGRCSYCSSAVSVPLGAPLVENDIPPMKNKKKMKTSKKNAASHKKK